MALIDSSVLIRLVGAERLRSMEVRKLCAPVEGPGTAVELEDSDSEYISWSDTEQTETEGWLWDEKA